MKEVKHYICEQDSQAYLRLREPTTLLVTQGRVWLTCVGDMQDYWISAGEEMNLRAHASYYLSADSATAFQLQTVNGGLALSKLKRYLPKAVRLVDNSGLYQIA